MARIFDLPDTAPSPFNLGVDHVLKLLHRIAPLDVWMLTRIEDNEQIVVRADDHGYGIQAGTAFDWSNSFCIRMLAERGPRITPDVQQVPAYQEALAAQPDPPAIGSYIGFPVQDHEYEMYGVLCAMNPEPISADIEAQSDQIQAAVTVIESLIRQRRQIDELEREREALRLEAYNDALTGTYNRRGWLLALSAEEQRCQDHSLPAGLVAIDLDNLKIVNDQEGHDAGDRLIKAAGQALRDASREIDIVARLGGDEFGVLLPETPADHLPEIAHRLRAALQEAGVSASIGYACRTVSGSLPEAQTSADAAMYADKRQRRRTPGP
ncbi:sensor domain-containing diguanylate cyclase [Thioalkalivibrio sp. ALM2T]|uniref:sensor domain-containing diguanylate cyclase n=1 Tax=Thioalkalivibrio sp. ALM2T TaxID=1158184 RepID=UPI000360F5F8|nr:sensor domain-containing diguanylate cyclase [Thioalkalivibrio sp. ALM2T]